MMNRRRITITKPPLHANFLSYSINLLFKTVIYFEFGCFKTFTISFLGKLLEIQSQFKKTMLTDGFPLIDVHQTAMGRVLMVTAISQNVRVLCLLLLLKEVRCKMVENILSKI